MESKVHKSLQRALSPQTLKTNIIVGSLFIATFEMLKETIIEKIEFYYTDHFGEKEVLSSEYKEQVLSLSKNVLHASLLWLKEMEAIDDKDISTFYEIRKCRNALSHEMLRFVFEGIEHEPVELFPDTVALLRKIEIWWFANLEIPVNPDVNPDDIDLDGVVPGPVWILQTMIDVALGPEEEAMKYYKHLVEAHKVKT